LAQSSRRGLPPVVIWRGVNPSHPRLKACAFPTAAASAVALIVPIPGGRRQAPHGLVVPRHPDELRVKGRNALIEHTPFGPRIFNMRRTSSPGRRISGPDDARRRLRTTRLDVSKPAKLQEFLPRSIPMMKMSIGLFLSI
jgi:hypothetical protein